LLHLHLLPHSFPTRHSSDLFLYALLPSHICLLCSPGALYGARVLNSPAKGKDLWRESKIGVGREGERGWVEELCSLYGPLFCTGDRKSTRLNSSHVKISYAV